LVLNLLLIGIGITLNPLPLLPFVLLLSGEQGTTKGLAYILGWLGCLVVIIAAVFLTTGNNPPAPKTVPSTAILAVKLAAGIWLIRIAMRRRRQMGQPRKPPAWMGALDHLSLPRLAGLAVFLQPWAMVAAGAATVAEAKLDSPGSVLALMFFCLLATSSMLSLELYTAFAGDEADVRLGKIRNWLTAHQEQVIIVVFLLLGFLLAGQSIRLLVG
jgi:hypothetical protein